MVYGFLTSVASLVGEHELYGAWALSSCGSQVPQLWCIALVALQHVESSQKRDKTVSPALAGEFLTTGPSDNPDFLTFNISTSAEVKVFEYR